MLVKFVKSYEIPMIKIKLVLIYVLNLTDIIFTILLMNTGMFIEANILMRKVINVPIGSILVKALVPMVLLLFLYHRMKSATKSQLYKGNIIIDICAIYYILINISHLVWIIWYILM